MKPSTPVIQGRAPCACSHAEIVPQFVVLTGGPGAGKTAVLDFAEQRFCHHVHILPEAASILFGGGFPRGASVACREASQRAIYHIQAEMEVIARETDDTCVVLCDRGTLDGLAYWPSHPGQYLTEVHTTVKRELARYAVIIHLRTPTAEHYSRANLLRLESAREAQAIDERILAVWDGHPNRVVIDNDDDFSRKVERAVGVIGAMLPGCCKEGV